MKENIFIDVDYEDGEQETFKAVKLHIGKEVLKYDTGDPLIDWYNVCKDLFSNDEFREKYDIDRIIVSSSFYHWFMDGNKYVEKYLKYENEKWEFVTDDEMKSPEFDESKHAFCVATSDMKSFEELKEYYQKNKNS